MQSKPLLAAAATFLIALAPASALAQGNDAGSAGAATNGAAAPSSAPANPAMGNAPAAAAPAASAADAGDATAPHPVYRVERGFPWGVLGLIGLIGLAPLFRRRND